MQQTSSTKYSLKPKNYQKTGEMNYSTVLQKVNSVNLANYNVPFIKLFESPSSPGFDSEEANHYYLNLHLKSEYKYKKSLICETLNSTAQYEIKKLVLLGLNSYLCLYYNLGITRLQHQKRKELYSKMQQLLITMKEFLCTTGNIHELEIKVSYFFSLRYLKCFIRNETF